MSVSIIELSSIQRPDNKPYTRASSDWVSLGESNDYFEQLVNLYTESNLHRSILTGISERVAGEGLTVDRPTIHADNLGRITSLFDNYTLEKIALEEALFGVFALKLTTNGAGSAIADVECVSMVDLRPEKMDDAGDINYWYFSRDWSNYRKKQFEPEPIPVFDFQASRQKGEFIAVFKRYQPGTNYIPDVPYSGGINWMQADIEISKYHLSNIQNGFSGVTAIIFKNGEPDTETKRRIEQRFKQKFTGASGDKIAFIYQKPGEESVEFETIQLDDADKQYEVLSKEINQRVMFAHKVTSPILLGIKEDTGLGNNADEMRNANNYFDKLTIRPKQKFILDSIGKILTYNGIGTRPKIKPLTFMEDIEAPEPEATRLSDEDEMRVLTDADQDYLIDYFDQHGEDEAELLDNGFKVVQEDDTPPDEELKIKGEQLRAIELADAWGIRPDKLSKYDVRAPDKSGVWLVRYQYALGMTEQPPEIIDTSRQFCRHMIDSKNSGNRVYKREIIEQLRNPEFGAYNIFRYKGSYNCRHRWRRKIYFKPAEGTQVNQVGNVPYVVNRLNDKMATRVNTKPKR